ncbi:hypothetical protein NS44R_14680, partial [Mammaliicoccus sciuri]
MRCDDDGVGSRLAYGNRLLGIHRDRIAFPQCAARMDDNDIGRGASDRFLDRRIEDRVARPVQGRLARRFQAEADDRTHLLDDRTIAVTGVAPQQPDAAPIDPVCEWYDVLEPQRSDLVLVAGLADQRQMLRHQGFGAGIEMIGMQVRNDDKLDAIHDVVDGDRQMSLIHNSR